MIIDNDTAREYATYLTGLFADQLREVFENHTQLRLTVPRICGITA